MNRKSHVAGLSLLVLLAATAGCKDKKAPNAWKLPVDAKQLPSNTTIVEADSIEGALEPDPHVRSMFMAGELGAEICREGALDPAHQLELLEILGTASAKQFFKPANLENVRSLLECGSALASSLEGNFQTAIHFVDESGAKAEVDVLQLKVTDLPPKFGLTKHAFGSLDGYCRTSDPARPGITLDCTASSEAAIKQGSTWFLGKHGELDEIAKVVAAPKAELSTQLAALNDAANELEGLSASRIETQLTSAKPFLRAPCTWGAFQTAGDVDNFVQGCFPTSDNKTIQDIDGKLRAAAFEMEPDVLKAKAVHGNIVLVARDEDAAKVVEKEAGELATDWKAQLENNESKLIKQAKTNPVSLRQKSWAVIVDNFSRALQKMKVARAGRVVKMSFNEPLAPEDARDLESSQKDLRDVRVAVADILAAIESKSPIPVQPLTKLIGAPWATYLVAESTWDPKALPPECTQAKKPKKGPATPDPRCVAPVEPANGLFAQRALAAR